MEQKTEASQAVDEPVLPHLPRAVGYRHTMDNTEGLKGNKPVVVFGATKPNPFGIPGLDYSASFPVTTETLFTASQMKEYARAALKAQPAPTEAPNFEQALQVFREKLQESQVPMDLEFAEILSKANLFDLYAADDTPAETQEDSFDPKDETIKKLQGLIEAYQQIIAGHEAREKRTVKYANSAQISASAAQGEDSARLDLIYVECMCKACNPIMLGRQMFICPKCGDKNCPHATNHVNRCQGRARASAETGGVKP